MSGNSSGAPAPDSPEIAYEVAERGGARVVVVDLLHAAIGDPDQSARLGQHLSGLIRPDLPRTFVLDFHNVKLVGSTAFGGAGLVHPQGAGGGRQGCHLQHGSLCAICRGRDSSQ